MGKVVTLAGVALGGSKVGDGAAREGDGTGIVVVIGGLDATNSAVAVLVGGPAAGGGAAQPTAMAQPIASTQTSLQCEGRREAASGITHRGP